MWEEIKKDRVIRVCLILLTSLPVILMLLPDNRPRLISMALQKHDICTQNVDFEFVKAVPFRIRVFQSSIPLYYNGNYHSLWQIRRYGPGRNFRFSYTVMPYIPDVEECNDDGLLRAQWQYREQERFLYGMRTGSGLCYTANGRLEAAF